MVDGATSEWIPIVAGMPQGNVSQWEVCPLLFILYISEMFELVKNRLYAYAVSTLLVVVRKPAGRPAVAASLYMDLARSSAVAQSLVNDSES